MSGGESIVVRSRRPWLPWAFPVFATGSTLGLALGARGEMVGWILFAILAAPCLLTGMMFHPDCHSLKLDESGLTETRWFRSRVHGWEQIESVDVCLYGGIRRVELLKAAPDGTSVKLGGHWQMSPDALAVLLRRWQARARNRLERAGPPF